MLDTFTIYYLYGHTLSILVLLFPLPIIPLNQKGIARPQLIPYPVWYIWYL
jgi:hypothetical protein